MPSDRIESIGNLIDLLEKERENFGGSLWYRGQADSSWSLIPSLHRQTHKMTEASLLTRFRQSAAMLTTSYPKNSFDWIFLMQHYGMPTRLLDWTENPLIALYFAIEDSSIAKDGALWMLSPSKLNKNAHIDDSEEADYVPSFEDEELVGYSTEKVRNDQRLRLLPIASIATRNNPRIQAQLGTFTIHHNKKEPIEEIGDGKHCRKFIIPCDKKKQLMEHLLLLGVNRFALFPEMESISRILKENI